MNSQVENDCWLITLDGRKIELQNPERLFAAAVLKEKTYTANRGTVKETVTEKGRVNLTRCTADEEGNVVLSGENGRRLKISLSEPEPGMLRMKLSFVII